MTPAQARAELPAVSVRFPNGKIYPAKVTGRLNQFATVTVSFIQSGGNRHLRDFGGLPWIDCQHSWESVARAATSGKPLSFD